MKLVSPHIASYLEARQELFFRTCSILSTVLIIDMFYHLAFTMGT